MIRRIEAHELHDLDDAGARAFLEQKLGPASTWHAPLIKHRFTSDFQEHWKNEVGHWLWTAERNGYLPRFLNRMILRANQSSVALTELKPDDALYTVLLQELAPAMAAHYLLGTGWTFVDWDVQPARGLDVDLVLRAPDGRTVDLQVKAPSQPSFFNDKDRDGIVLRRVDDACGQLPDPARSASLIVICADRLWGLSGEPDAVIRHLVGTTTGYGHGLVLLRRPDVGQFFSGRWAHVGGVMLLDYHAGISLDDAAEHFLYSCTVVLNPRADSTARCERDWFPRARVLWLDSTTFHWDDDAPGRCGFPEGTVLADE